MSREILGIIPARGGSKGIPRKNLRPLAGRPLIDYTFDAAKASHRLSRTVLSTDCAEIAQTGRRAGIEVPFLRPEELARDDTSTLRVVQHLLEWLARNERYLPDVVVLLQPTAPFRKGAHVDEAVDLLISSDADAVVSVTEVPDHFNPHWQFVVGNGALRLFDGRPLDQIPPRRQELPTTYTRNGAVYAFLRDPFQATGSLYGDRCLAYVMPSRISINIDTWDDWRRAEQHLRDDQRSGEAA